MRRQRHRQGGATRLELAVAATLAALLLGLLLDRLIACRAEAERVAVKQLVASLRTALAVRSTEAIVRGGQDALTALARENPMLWLQKTPPNYLGEVEAGFPARFANGHWYFDRGAGTLVYLPLTHKSFSSGTQKMQMFKVELLRIPDPVDASAGRKGSITGLVLDQIEDRPLAWNKHVR